MAITVKKCTIEDLSELQKISKVTFTETFEEHNAPEHLNAYLEKAYNSGQLASELANPSSEFYFVCYNEDTAGYLKINTGDAQTEPMGREALEIERIYVKNKFHKHGLGKRLMEEAFDIAARGMKTKIWLGVWENNENALAFYEKKGFVQQGSHSFFMGDDEQVDLIMVKTITP